MTNPATDGDGAGLGNAGPFAADNARVSNTSTARDQPADLRLIATIAKNSREELRVTLDEFRGYRLLKLRVWFKAGDGEGRPDHSDLALKKSSTRLISVLAKVRIQALDAGWLK